jgi:DNA polymerase elongation subunit (family B)
LPRSAGSNIRRQVFSKRRKKAKVAAKQRDEDASAVLADLGRRSVDVYNVTTHLITLKNSELKALVAWKLGGEKVPSTKTPLIASWLKNNNSDEHSSFEEWTRDEEATLTKLLDEDIKLGETEYGRQQDVVVQSVKSTAANLSASQIAEIKAIVTADEVTAKAVLGCEHVWFQRKGFTG